METNIYALISVCSQFKNGGEHHTGSIATRKTIDKRTDKLN